MASYAVSYCAVEYSHTSWDIYSTRFVFEPASSAHATKAPTGTAVHHDRAQCIARNITVPHTVRARTAVQYGTGLRTVYDITR